MANCLSSRNACVLRFPLLMGRCFQSLFLLFFFQICWWKFVYSLDRRCSERWGNFENWSSGMSVSIISTRICHFGRHFFQRILSNGENLTFEFAEYEKCSFGQCFGKKTNQFTYLYWDLWKMVKNGAFREQRLKSWRHHNSQLSRRRRMFSVFVFIVYMRVCQILGKFFVRRSVCLLISDVQTSEHFV